MEKLVGNVRRGLLCASKVFGKTSKSSSGEARGGEQQSW